jgi:hypothetical protein
MITFYCLQPLGICSETTSDSKIYAVKIMKLRTLKLLDFPSIYDDAALPSFMAFTIINLDSCKTLINAE